MTTLFCWIHLIIKVYGINQLQNLKQIETSFKIDGADVSEHFTGNFQAKQQINITFPLELLRSIDAECQRQKIDRQDWIKLVCAEKIRDVQVSRK